MKISIITCTFNSEKYLKKNIDSVKSQNYKNFEHIFIDGYSKDNTINIIKKYQKFYPEKVKIFQTSPKGISNAMNIGIKKSTGKYLIHLHSDDSFYKKNVIKKVVNFLEINNYPDWIYGKASVINEKYKLLGIFPKKKYLQLNKSPFSIYLLKFFNFIPHQTVFIKRNIFKKYGYFDESIKSKMDLDLWIRLRKSTRWLFLNEIISYFMVRPGAQSSDKKNKKINEANFKKIQKRYMNYIEYSIAKIFNLFVKKIKKDKQIER